MTLDLSHIPPEERMDCAIEMCEMLIRQAQDKEAFIVRFFGVPTQDYSGLVEIVEALRATQEPSAPRIQARTPSREREGKS